MIKYEVQLKCNLKSSFSWVEPSSFCGSSVQGEWEEGLDLEPGHAVSGDAGQACKFGHRVRGVQEPDLKALEQGVWEWGWAVSLGT